MISWVKENPIYTSIGVTFVVALILVITSTVQLSKHSKETAPTGLKVMQSIGYVLMVIVGIALVLTVCTTPGVNCTPLMYLRL